MSRRPKEKPLGYEPYPELAYSQMYDLVHALNGVKIRLSLGSGSKKQTGVRRHPSDSQEDLQRLVQAWMESGPDLIKMFKKEPELESRIRYGRTQFYPMHDGRGHLDWIPEITGGAQPAYKDQALKDFLMLITNPRWELLGGPCARCGDYYLKKTRRQKSYCSRNCSSEATAIASVKRRREQEQTKKIQRAQSAIEEWGKRKRRLAWKDWISNETGYSARWITRAVNSRRLMPPTEQKMNPLAIGDGFPHY